MGVGSGIRDTKSGIRKKTYSGSRIQGSKRHRIPDPQHCIKVKLVLRIFIRICISAECGIRIRIIVKRQDPDLLRN
jgi:hypothetical protein